MAEVVGFQSAAQLRGLLDQLTAGLLARRLRLVIRGATRPLAPELVFWAGEGRLCLPNGAGVGSSLVRALSAEGGRAEIAPLAAELWAQARDRAAPARAALDDAEARARATERILAPWGGWAGPVERTAEGLRGRLGPIGTFLATDVEPTTLAELLAQAEPLDVVVVGLFGRGEGQAPSVVPAGAPQGGPQAPVVEPVAEARGAVEPVRAAPAAAAILATAVATSAGAEATQAAASVPPSPPPHTDPAPSVGRSAPPPPARLPPPRPSRDDRPSADELGEWRAPSPWPWIAAVLALLLLLSWRLFGGEPPPPPPPTPDPVVAPPPPPPPPPSPSPTPVVVAGSLPIAGPGDDERLRRAEKLIERGRYEEAEGLLDAVERDRPGDPVLWMLWSHLRLEQGRDGEALTAIDRSLKLDPRRFRAHVIRGSVLQLSGRGRDAIRAYRTALDLDPKHPMGPEIRGIVDRLDD